MPIIVRRVVAIAVVQDHAGAVVKIVVKVVASAPAKIVAEVHQSLLIEINQ